MKKKVLIIEGHEGLRQLMTILLSRKYRVYAAADGIEALAWLSTGEIPHVIIAESAMRELSLDDFLHAIQSSGIYAHIPVVLTDEGSAASQAFKKYHRNTAVRDFVSLPLKPADLICAITRMTSTKVGDREVLSPELAAASPVWAPVSSVVLK